MARFKNSNRIAAAQMSYVESQKARNPKASAKQEPYLRRTGYDFAMI